MNKVEFDNWEVKAPYFKGRSMGSFQGNKFLFVNKLKDHTIKLFQMEVYLKQAERKQSYFVLAVCYNT
jgi:hypothetical protein